MNREGDSPDYEELYNRIYSLNNVVNHLEITNAKLVESLEYLRSCYDLELLNKTKLVEENEILKEANNNKATYVEEMESELNALKDENERFWKEKENQRSTIIGWQDVYKKHFGLDDMACSENLDYKITESKSRNKLIKLQSELNAAKERVMDLEKNARQLCTLLAKDQVLFFLSQGEKDGIMDILKTLTPKQHG